MWVGGACTTGACWRVDTYTRPSLSNGWLERWWCTGIAWVNMVNRLGFMIAGAWLSGSGSGGAVGWVVVVGRSGGSGGGGAAAA